MQVSSNAAVSSGKEPNSLIHRTAHAFGRHWTALALPLAASQLPGAAAQADGIEPTSSMPFTPEQARNMYITTAVGIFVVFCVLPVCVVCCQVNSRGRGAGTSPRDPLLP